MLPTPAQIIARKGLRLAARRDTETTTILSLQTNQALPQTYTIISTVDGTDTLITPKGVMIDCDGAIENEEVREILHWIGNNI